MSYSDSIRHAQRLLQQYAGYEGTLDGDVGTLSLKAARRVMPIARPGWSPVRHVVGVAQVLLQRHGDTDPGPIDGLWGPQTEAAWLLWSRARAGTPFVRPDPPQLEAGPVGRWPREREADLREWFGPPGSAACSAGRVIPPWRMVLAWDLTDEVEAIACHIDVASSLQRILENVADSYTPAEIVDLGLHLYGGCFNPRPKRGGTDWSTHAWGIAVDFDTARNRLQWGRDRARLAQPDAAAFWSAVQLESWAGLGPARNYDWMHIQAADL
mgnify:CR=1 FL=1